MNTTLTHVTDGPRSRFAFQPINNRLLAALPTEEFQRIAPLLEYRSLKARERLHKQGERLSEVFFPLGGICSITSPMEDGGMVEVAAVGSEGLLGVPAAFGVPVSMGESFVQVQGDGAQVMSVDAFHREIARRGVFHNLVMRYSQAFVGMLMQSVACNGLHTADERCCRWLLTTRDRLDADEFPLTHEYLAMMLGVRRPTITLIMAQLSNAGVISHMRGRIRITDRQGLETMSCECYRVIKDRYDELLV